MRRRRAPRPYRGQKMRVLDLAVKHDVSKEARDTAGRWTHLHGTSPSVAEQTSAQYEATKAWGSAVVKAGGTGQDFQYDVDDTLMLPSYSPEAGWAYYQTQAYGPINKYLRTGEDTDMEKATDGALSTKASVLAAATIKAFDTMGHTTESPMTLFRVEKGNGVEKAENFHVGDVVTEKGVVSAAAQPDEVAGFLDDNPGQNPFAMRITVPIGTRVLGGYAGGIETMLKPGSKFLVTSITKGIIGQKSFTGQYRVPVVNVELVP